MTTVTAEKTTFKLKNPTEYHILAQQQQQQPHFLQQQPLVEDYGQQFFSTEPNSPLFQDFEEDTESFINGSSIGNMMIQPPSYFFPNNQDYSPSEYGSSVDFLSHPHPTSFLMDFHEQTFSAPAHLGYHNSLLSSSTSMTMAAYHQPPENMGPRSLEEYESMQTK